MVVRNLVTRFVDASEAEVAILTYFAILGTVHYHGFVPDSAKLCVVSVCNCKTDGLTTKPIT